MASAGVFQGGDDNGSVILSDTESVSSIASSKGGQRRRRRKQQRNKQSDNTFGPKLTPKELKFLLQDKSKLAVELRARKALLKKLLHRDDIAEEMMSCLLNVLDSVAQNPKDEDAQEVFRFLARLSFIQVHLMLFALNQRMSSCPPNDESSITSLLSVLQAFLRYDASTADSVRMVVVLLQDSLRCGTLQSKGKKVEKAINYLHVLISKGAEGVPKHYRTTSTFPSGGEVMDPETAGLSNVVDLQHPSVRDYIAVHHHLLREDIVEPIRKVIQDYHRIKRERGLQAAITKCRLLTNTQLCDIITSHSSKGVAFRVHFDVANLQHITWEKTKILSFGTMVCLTSTHFHSMIFATVAKRDPQWLQKGFVDLRLFRPEDMVALTSGGHFFMIDSQQYVEESYEVLEVMKSTSIDTLPLPQHVVYMCAEQDLSKHLKNQPNVEYDVGPLMQDYKSSRRTCSVPLLEMKRWPPIAEMGVDEQQLKAIHSALTRQVTVITGSPGTGKTFVGLKLVEVFQCNQHKLNKNKNAGAPLVFICATRATLDEFLTGVSYFQRKGIVRCGGPQTRKNLEDYQLDKLRKEHGSSTHLADESCSEALKQCKTRLMKLQENFKKLGDVILPDEALKEVMGETSYKSLKESKMTDVSTVILDWLLTREDDDGGFGKRQAEVPFHVARFTCKEGDDSWLGRHLPVVLDCTSSSPDAKMCAYVSKMLHSNEKMAAGDEKDLWRLKPLQRWSLYRTWIAKLKIKVCEQFKNLWQEMKHITLECQKAHDEVDVSILQEASIIGMTASSAAKNRRILEKVGPLVVILEEAADILQSTTAVLPQSVQQMILIGESDPKLHQFQAVKTMANQHGVHASLMQQLLNHKYSVHRLSTQHRMSPIVSKLSRLLSAEDYESDQFVVNLPAVAGIAHNVFFIDHHEQMSPAKHEAAILLALLDYLTLQKGVLRKSISILTSHPAQLTLFKGKASDRALPLDFCRGGNDIILFMSSGSERESKPGCLLTDQRITAALTYAKRGLYVVGNFDFLSDRSPLWAKILKEVRRLGWVDKGLKLSCPNHPNNPFTVSTPQEFSRLKEKQGCGLPCQVRLDCGHCCKEPCHDHDRNKAFVVCHQPCNRQICKNGHKCTRSCSEPCDTQCKERIEKQLPCGHRQLLPCCLDPQKATCKDKCERVLHCGHKCSGICGKPCKEKCLEVTTKSDWPCGHRVQVQCNEGPDSCPAPCKIPLECGHLCGGTCGMCKRGRLHVVCQHPCGRTLVCGHSCESNCSTQCPPCRRKCENQCQHSDCHKICGEMCVPCQERCLWSCPHFSCPKLCGEPCDRSPCSEPCTKTLRCGHPCIGMCGEMCPKKCRVCDKEEVTEILFGNEDEEDARFVQLEDCGHLIEVDGLDHYMNMSQEGEDGDAVTIQLKCCPKCKTPIRKNLRYGNIIKQTLGDLENVKTKIRGDQKEIDQRMSDLTKKLGELRRHRAYRDEFVDEEDLGRLTSGLKQMKHLEKVVARVNRCAFLRAIVDVWAKWMDCDQIFELSGRQRQVEASLNELKSAVIEGELDQFNEQQRADIQRELCRINLQMQVLNLLRLNMSSLSRNLQSHSVKNFDKLVNRGVPFTVADEARAGLLVKEIKQSMGQVVLGITHQERVQIVEAMGLSQGHWFKCPQGHVYAIGECGGAMEKAKCPECQSDIGGESHRLTGGNRLATEMDGATRAAWPTGGGMFGLYGDAAGEQVEFDPYEIEEQFQIEREIREQRLEEERRMNQRVIREAEERRAREERERRTRAERELRERMGRAREERERLERERRTRAERERLERERHARAEREREERERRTRAERERVERERARAQEERVCVERLRIAREQEILERSRQGMEELTRRQREREAREQNPSAANCTIS